MKYEIGRKYLIDVVKTTDGYYLPVVWPPHDDTDKFINNSGGITTIRSDRHIHVNWRFVSIDMLIGYKNYEGKSFLKMYIDNDPILYEWDNKYVTKKLLMCYRNSRKYFNNKQLIDVLTYKYEKSPILNNRCPHQGYDLAKEQSVDGCVVCPLHGLKINLEKGCVVKQ